MSKHDLIQELWEKYLDLSAWERDDRDISGTSVDDTQGFAFSSRGFSLTLKIHGESTSRGIMRAGSKEAMGMILPRLFHFAFRAISEDASSVAS
jgi:hypothetical protein